MITVVVPTCDRPLEFLTQSIASAFAQSLKPKEVVVIDNGRSRVDAASLPDGVRLYHLPPHSGPSKARNFGAAIADGTHVAFLDDDDYWHPDFLKNAMTAIEASDADCAYGHIHILRHGEESSYSGISKDALTIDRLVRSNPGVGGINLLIRRDAFWLAGGYDESLRVSEDRGLAIEIIKAGIKTAIAPNAIAVMREHGFRRQRYSDLHRLPFIWKYRKEIGLRAFCERGVSIITKAIRRRLRSFGKMAG